MSLKHPRPLMPRAVSSAHSSTQVRRFGADCQQYLQERLQKSITERRKIAAAHAGIPANQNSAATQSSASAPKTGAQMAPHEVQDHIRAHLERRGSWIERRIARLQTEVKQNEDDR